MTNEIAPPIDLPPDELEAFTKEVIERFKNPFIRHELRSISLNAISKFKVRVLPSLKDYLAAKGTLPNRLVFAFACQIKLYLWDDFSINDDKEALRFFDELKKENLSFSELAKKIMGQMQFWGEDLNQLSGFTNLVAVYLERIGHKSVREVLKEL